MLLHPFIKDGTSKQEKTRRFIGGSEYLSPSPLILTWQYINTMEILHLQKEMTSASRFLFFQHPMFVCPSIFGSCRLLGLFWQHGVSSSIHKELLPLKTGHPKRNFILKPLIFRCYLSLPTGKS